MGVSASMAGETAEPITMPVFAYPSSVKNDVAALSNCEISVFDNSLLGVVLSGRGAGVSYVNDRVATPRVGRNCRRLSIIGSRPGGAWEAYTKTRASPDPPRCSRR